MVGPRQSGMGLRRLQNRQPGRYAEFARMLDDSARALTVATAGPAQIENK